MAIETETRVVVLQRSVRNAKLNWRIGSTPAVQVSRKHGRPAKEHLSGYVLGLRVCGTENEVDAAVNTVGDSSWVSFDKKLTARFLRAATEKPNFKISRFIQIQPTTSPQTLSSLQGFVRHGVVANADHKWLPKEELFEVLKAPESERRDVFLGGSVDFETKTVALVRGNFESMTVPFSFFRPSGDGVKAEFDKIGFTDYGHTIALGDYEAAADCVLYERDPEFRRRLNQQRQAEEKTFGACLRRLRKQRGLKRSDFPGIDEKTVARLERNESAKPHGKTLQILADRLGVSPDEIESF